MTTEREIFNISGPLYLTDVDWNNFYHRRSVAASLVQGVYNLERERQQEPQAHALPWWDFFHFQLNRLLKDDKDHSIIGAIYELKSFAFNYSAPKYVIAFRGTLLKPDSLLHDLKEDLNFICNKLHKRNRFEQAMQAVQNMITSAGDHKNIWLAGHSLGSAMALLVGKNMAKMGYCIETYLFNPPFVSAPIEKITNQQLKHAIRIPKSFVKAGLAVAIKGHHHRQLQDNSFVVLSNWVPYLFVNPADHICSEYIGYFEHRKKMEEIGAGKVERLATQNSIVSLLGIGNSEPLHLLPSAYLTINLSQSPDFKGAHGIRQWWDPNFHNWSVPHQFM